MSLQEYRRKRDFAITPEPAATGSRRAGKLRRFVIQKHAASRLHFDFRLELNGALVSWAVPKGLPLIHNEKRLAMKVEDHPLSYFKFEGSIPKGQYGGGTVQVWDAGTFEPLSKKPLQELAAGKLHFILHGAKLQGEWYLVRLREKDQWLIVRGGEDHPELSAKLSDTSVLTGRTLGEIAQDAPVKDAGKKTSGKIPPAMEDHRDISISQNVTFIEPMKARLVATAPAGEWSYEIKFDGFRALAYKQKEAVSLQSRTNHSFAEKFPDLVEALQRIDARQAILDGEIVALDPQGRSSFQLLQAFESGQEQPPLYYYVFDLLELNGSNLRQRPLEERKELLKSLLPENQDVIRYSASLGNNAEALLALARKHNLEGLIGKRAGSVYEVGKRSGAWIKLKFSQEQEFVIGGYTEPSGTRTHFGALLVGFYEKGRLHYAGKAGTGFNEAMLRDLHARFSKIAQEACPFCDLPEARPGRYSEGITASVMKHCHWLKPQLVAQIKFSEWTRDGRLRQPVFLGLRPDKPAKKVVRETP